MKIIPLYLPQFHCIPENDEWWGKGFTDWVNVRKAIPLFPNHYQPRVPLNNNYYDLSKVETLKWQCKIARDHGIYGFSFYHYWFNGRLLLEKPMEMLLHHPEINIRYSVCWANHDWNNGWKTDEKHKKTLMTIDFDDEADWVNHFNYLLPFFKDPRYIKEDNKPFVTIYIPQLIGKLDKMLDLWDSLAKQNGFNGLTYLYQCAPAFVDKGWDRSRFKYGIEFNPDYTLQVLMEKNKAKLFSYIVRYSQRIKRMLHINRKINLPIINKGVKTYDYDKIWTTYLEKASTGTGMLPSAYVDWDNTARKQYRGSVHLGACPEKFKKYFRELVIKTREEYHQDKIFVFAWNEWAEGGYLEPDQKYGFGYLDAIKDVLTDLNELE